MKRIFALIALLCLTAVILAACGSGDATTTTTAPEAEEATATTTAPEATASEDALESYREDVKEWWAEWTPKVEEHSGALDNLDALTVTDEQIEAVGKFAEIMADSAKDFRDIEPPACAAWAGKANNGPLTRLWWMPCTRQLQAQG